LLRYKKVRELLGEDLGVVLRGEVTIPLPPSTDRVDDPAHQLTNRALTLGRPERPAEVLLSDDVGCVLRPGLGELDVALLEGVAALLVVRDDGVANLPLEVVERMASLGREVPPEGQSRADDLQIPLAIGHLPRPLPRVPTV